MQKKIESHADGLGDLVPRAESFNPPSVSVEAPKKLKKKKKKSQ